MRLLQFLNEQDMKVNIVIGRFNPPHKGHLELIKAASKSAPATFILVIDGKKSSQDKEKNPIPGVDRVKILTDIIPSNCKAILASSAYIPDVFTKEHLDDLEMVKGNNLTIFCGADRVASYKRMAISIDKELNSTTEVKELDFDRAGVSASLVRKLMREGKYQEAQQYLPYPVSKIEKYF